MIGPDCGTVQGVLAHQAAREMPCGWCVYAEQVARLMAEAVPERPSRAWAPHVPASLPVPPVTEEQARRNRFVLDEEVAAAERSDHPDWYRDARKPQNRGARGKVA